VKAEDRAALELRTLAGLCAGASSAARAGIRRLTGYTWTSPDAAAMYSAVRAALAKNARLDRETLTAIATREGFPDLDWETLLKPAAAHENVDASALIAQLLA
jgi:hypothetical protein